MNKGLVLSLLMIMLVSQVWAGPWNRAKGKGYSQFSLTFLTYDQLLNGGSQKIDLKRNISDYTFQFYAEYGLSDKFNLILNLPYKFVSSSDQLNNVVNDPYINDTLESGSLSGLSNIDIGLRYVILQKKYILSAQLMFSNKMHQYSPASGLRIGYDSYLLTPSLLLGRGWEKIYLQMGAGLQLKFNDYAQNFSGMFEVGKKLFNNKTIITLRFDVKLPLNEGTYDEGNSVQTGLFRDNSSYVSPGIKFIQQLSDHFYLNLAGYGAVYSELEGAQATFNAALAYEW